MAAGLPGVGLSGLFMLLSALLMPVVELVQTARGRSSAARWRLVGRQWGLAAAMVAGYFAVFVLLRKAITAIGLTLTMGPRLTPAALGGWGVVAVSMAVLMALLASFALAARALNRS